jgi:hypothetical protein
MKFCNINVTEPRPVGAYLIQAMRADRRTGMINLMGAFRDLLYAKAPKKGTESSFVISKTDPCLF